MSHNFNEIKSILWPESTTMGYMEADPEKCSYCGLCIANCPFKCWKVGTDRIPQMKENHVCLSCFNCMVACPDDAISIIETYSVNEGYFAIGYPDVLMPLQPKNHKGEPDNWNSVEKLILERRSVRNFKANPVPETLLERILEAGRFAPSSGNQQPWKFTVVTDQSFLGDLETACLELWSQIQPDFEDDEAVVKLLESMPTDVFDPRVRRGIRCIATQELPIFLNAPAAIFIGCNEKMSFPEQHAGICGQNMTIAAKSLGLGCCWSNFAGSVDMIPELKTKLGYGESWKIYSVLCLGYPEFQQEGFVARQRRPVTWFTPDSKGPEIR